MQRKLVQSYKLLLDQVDENQSFTNECIENIMDKVTKGEKLAIEFIQNSDEKVFELLDGKDFTEINQFISNIAWLLTIYKEDLKELLKSC